MVYNAGEEQHGFAICLKCGYADSEPAYKKGKPSYPKDFESHAPLHDKDQWSRCWKTNDKAPELRNQILAARETTDVLMLDFADCTSFSSDTSVMLTIGYALQRAGAQLLEIDSRELGVMLAPCRKSGNSAGVVIYDTAAGGAGHVFELMKIGRPWLEQAFRVLTANGEPTHDQRCQRACLDCILSFDNQMNIDRLNRRLTLRVLKSLLEGTDFEPASGGSASPSPLSAQGVGGNTLKTLSKEERLRRSKRK